MYMPCPNNLHVTQNYIHCISPLCFYTHQVRDAAEESDTGSQLVEPDVIVVQPPSPVRGPEGEDTGTDNAQLIYASVSEEHKQKKRYGHKLTYIRYCVLC